MNARDAQVLANQAEGWAQGLLRIKDGILAVATAEQQVADAKAQQQTLASEVSDLKMERTALRGEMERLKKQTETECADLRAKAKRECEALVEKTAGQRAPLTAECEAWRTKTSEAKREHEQTLALLQREREAVGQQVRQLQDDLKSLAGPLAKLAGMG